jgi:hypothetical protein
MEKWMHQLGSCFKVLGTQHPEIFVRLDYTDIIERDVCVSNDRRTRNPSFKGFIASLFFCFVM